VFKDNGKDGNESDNGDDGNDAMSEPHKYGPASGVGRQQFWQRFIYSDASERAQHGSKERPQLPSNKPLAPSFHSLHC